MFAVLLAALLAVSPPAGASSGGDPGAEALVPVELVTFNTWGLPAPVAERRRERFPRIRRFLERASADVIGLQEVWRGARRLLGGVGLRFPGGHGDTGLAVLSRLPVRSTASLRFKEARGFDRFKSKGALLATVTPPGAVPLHVVTTHLQSGRGRGARAARAAQVDALLARCAGLSGPVAIMGDFNLYPDLLADRATDARLAEAGFVDVAAARAVTGPTHPGEGARLDRVYLRGGSPLDAELLDPGPLSDHRPLRVRVGLPFDPR